MGMVFATLPMWLQIAIFVVMCGMLALLIIKEGLMRNVRVDLPTLIMKVVCYVAVMAAITRAIQSWLR